MNPLNKFVILSVWFCMLSFIAGKGFAQSGAMNDGFDVTHYHVRITPEIVAKTIEGQVSITFKTGGLQKIMLDCGDLSILDVKGEKVKNFYQQNTQLVVELDENRVTEYVIDVSYEGKPERGVNFLGDQNQVYTNFFTNEWMVSHDVPNDPATIQTDLVIPDSLRSVASGTFTSSPKTGNGKTIHTWIQDFATPPYTYGFAIGTFNHASKVMDGITFEYYSAKYDEKQLETIFEDTPDMMQFMQEKAGVAYPQKSYSQVLIGNHYQEMAGFAVLRESYGILALQDSTETNLFSHELAHQWWGNMITCNHWEEMWLNEAMATYMSAAYNEHRFGREIYERDIQAYETVYQKIRDAGEDKSLIFDDWSNPTQNDRNLVYFKGAYVLHVLREKMGDQSFWEGIKFYSQQNFGKTVTTKNFQEALEKSSGTDLQDFFDEWIY